MGEPLEGSDDEKETCPDCGTVHSVYDEHESNNCVEVLRAEVTRLTAENARLKRHQSRVGEVVAEHRSRYANLARKFDEMAKSESNRALRSRLRRVERAARDLHDAISTELAVRGRGGMGGSMPTELTGVPPSALKWLERTLRAVLAAPDAAESDSLMTGAEFIAAIDAATGGKGLRFDDDALRELGIHSDDEPAQGDEVRRG